MRAKKAGVLVALMATATLSLSACDAADNRDGDNPTQTTSLDGGTPTTEDGFTTTTLGGGATSTTPTTSP